MTRALPSIAAAELTVDCRCELGEGPCWDAATETLLWVDITPGRIHRRGSGSEVETIQLDRTVGAVAPRAGGGLVAAVADGFLLLDGEGGIERHVPVEADLPHHRMNDGKVDRLGRFWAGTTHLEFRPGAGALYRLDPDGAVERVLGDLTLSNGLDYSPGGELLYFIDSLTHRVDVFDLDEPVGRLRNRRTFVSLPEVLGIPDGMTVDAEGNVWVAFWDGGRVRGWDASGSPLGDIPLPTARVTCCAFGGPDLDRLYITTATGTGPALEPPAGALFAARPGSRGQARAAFGG
jgi:sugar lactone lactonase YvrE